MSHSLCIRTRYFILIYPYSNWQMTYTYLWYSVKCFGILYIAEWPLQFKIIDIPSVAWDEDTSRCSVFSSVQGFVCYKHPAGQHSTQPCGSRNSCDPAFSTAPTSQPLAVLSLHLSFPRFTETWDAEEFVFWDLAVSLSMPFSMELCRHGGRDTARCQEQFRHCSISYHPQPQVT